ncbi:hypothetical protein LLG96_02510 [bacterium]|nr:hypothetical protein [bacterium]
MVKGTVFLSVAVFCLMMIPAMSCATDLDELVRVVSRSVSGNRARDYTMRLWQYDKWNTFPMWKKTAREAQAIMKERGFDEAEIVDTPADGVTQHGTWTNPISWDVKQATLEVIEPKGLPDEYRLLCNYLDNPTSVNMFSCPTPPGGLETELVLLEDSDPGELDKIDARGKIILISSGPGGFKRYLDKYGIPGILTDTIEGINRDFIDANNWNNTWSDRPGGWLMNAADSRNNFAFSISQKKGNYLRNLLRQGRTVKVRAVIDSRYYTDDTLPYVTGCVKGSGAEGEDVLIVGHMYEWGANDNCTGTSAILESIGTLNDLIRSGVLPRPRRSIRAWLGFEMYGSMAFTMNNLEHMRTKTIACVCCDTPAADYDASTTAFNISMNFNACPSFTDAVWPEVAGRFYSRDNRYKLWKTLPFTSGRDNFFGDPLIGVPLNSISMNNGGHLHHNSMDTIDKTDPRTLRDLGILNAVYLYYIANAGYDDVPVITNLTFDRAVNVILEKKREFSDRIPSVSDGAGMGKLLYDGTKTIEYYTALEQKALAGIERIVSSDRQPEVRASLARYIKNVGEFGKLMTAQLRDEANEKAKAGSIKIVKYEKPEGPWEKEAAGIVPRRTKVGTLTFDGIPIEEWKEVRSAPSWWSSRSWAASSYFWCDGKRNLNEIKDLIEFEAGAPVRNFDLIEYYKFLEKYKMVEFVK